MEARRVEDAFQAAETKETVAFMTAPVSGYGRPTRITFGAMTSCMSEPMRDEPFGC